MRQVGEREVVIRVGVQVFDQNLLPLYPAQGQVPSREAAASTFADATD